MKGLAGRGFKTNNRAPRAYHQGLPKLESNHKLDLIY